MRTPAPGAVVDEKYRLLARVGGGGMGQVFCAREIRANRLVAIKVLNPELSGNTEVVARFFQEAQAINRVRHPNIVHVIDTGTAEVGPYIVMEYLDGASVGTILGRLGKISQTAAIAIAIPVLDALDAAHRAGIVHRDLKPENVFVALGEPRAGEPPMPTVRLLDFGIAKVAAAAGGPAPRTRTGVVFGTPDYLSPEQATGEAPLDGRSDLFSWGIVMFEMLSGRRPFTAATAVATAFRVVHTEAPTLASCGVDVEPRLEQILRKLLEKDPGRRHAVAGDVSRELERIAPDPAEKATALLNILRGNIAPQRTPPLGRDAITPVSSGVHARQSTPPGGSSAWAAVPGSGEAIRGHAAQTAAALEQRAESFALPAEFLGCYSVRGPVLRAVDWALKEVHGRRARDRVVAKMPAEYLPDFRDDSINALVAYELEELDGFMAVATREVLRDVADWRELGRISVLGDLHAVVRTLLRPADLPSVTRRGVSIWSRLFGFGAWQVSVDEEKRVILQISQFEPASLPLRHWFVGVVEAVAREAAGDTVQIDIIAGEQPYAYELTVALWMPNGAV